MTISIFEFTDINEETGDVIWPAKTRSASQALDAYVPATVGIGSGIRAVIIYNDSGTTGIHVRIATAASGQAATQSDLYIGPDGMGKILLQRKDRSQSNNLLFVHATADT